ncbi:MAG: mechanosensitive ion channel [Proteobacteria bacterium]|nr:mechanosensitive ion channel [Pseudomonadota bacterium]
MNSVTEFIDRIISVLSVPLLSFGGSTLTISVIIYFTIIMVLLVYVTAKLKDLIIYRLLAKSNIEIGVRVAVASLVRYLILSIGFIVILQTAGIDLSSITVLFGALGVGIGFGLQNVTNNFVSGLIILLERPIKVGDRIEVAGISGDVVNISMRATTIRTNDNISIIVPNSEFVSSTVINWSHTDRNVRFNFPVGVSYKEEPEAIRKLLLQVADENSGILKQPPPDVLFSEYADSALIFNLRVWTSDYIDRPGVLKSQLYYAIYEKFKEHGVEIPFPQRDIHIKEESTARHVQE